MAEDRWQTTEGGGCGMSEIERGKMFFLKNCSAAIGAMYSFVYIGMSRERGRRGSGGS
jgi:hypothetical protein